jgi:phage terminase small subunit
MKRIERNVTAQELIKKINEHRIEMYCDIVAWLYHNHKDIYHKYLEYLKKKHLKG